MIGPFTGGYGFLSNFYYSFFTVDGLTYPTVEHYYQSKKAFHFEDENMIRLASSPADAKKMGRSIHMRPDFEDTKHGVMLTGVLAKFMQSEHLRNKLVATGYEHLEEVNNWGDRHWGTVNGEGENWLGQILITVRNCFAHQ
jgi:ribA/ribD-fused uncharacterized protein